MKEENHINTTFICEECNSLNFIKNITLKKHNIFECHQCFEESYFTKGVEFVYVLDSAYGSLLKLGYTTREPTDRLNEINLATGAIPWDVALYFQTLSGHKLEQEFYALFKEYRILKKEQLDIRLSDLVSMISREFQIIPSYIRSDLSQINTLVSKLTIDKENESVLPKAPILECPNCGFQNDTPYSYVRTFCKSCGRVVPRK